jgi:3'-phosphoadenosine 5'-phosphosulfate sulfotransferase (PAPS reductase)/FAD synthetase
MRPRDADEQLSPEGKRELILLRDTAMSRIDLPKNRKVRGKGSTKEGNPEIVLEPIGAPPAIAPLLYTVIADMQLAGSLEYGMVWIPDLVEGMGLTADEVYKALAWLRYAGMVELFWAPGVYSESGKFSVDPAIPRREAAMLREDVSGGIIGYVRLFNGHPLRQSARLASWADVAAQAAAKRPGGFKKPTTHEAIHKLLRAGAPLVVSWGIGRDSTAMLIEMARQGIRPDAILYAEVGNEKPETYAYKEYFEKFLREVGFPRVQIVKARVGHEQYFTLEEELLYYGTLPSIAYGYQDRRCSHKWKVVPQDKFLQGWPVAQEAWRQGLPVVMAIGFDDSPEERTRTANNIQHQTPQTVKWFPLQEWGWDLDRVIEEIDREGIQVPVKSACFFCSASQPYEVQWLAKEHPEYLPRIEAIEISAARKNKVEGVGLWFTGTKVPTALQQKYPFLGNRWFLSGRWSPEEIEIFNDIRWGSSEVPVSWSRKIKTIRERDAIETYVGGSSLTVDEKGKSWTLSDPEQALVDLGVGIAKARRAKQAKMADDLMDLRERISKELKKLRSSLGGAKPSRWTDFIRAYNTMCEQNPGDDECDVDKLAKRMR